MFNAKERNYSSFYAKIVLFAFLVFVSGCRANFTLPDEYEDGKWMVYFVQGVHEALNKNQVNDCGFGANNKTNVSYALKEHKDKNGEYLVDCRKWWGGGHVYKVQTKTQEVTSVY